MKLILFCCLLIVMSGLLLAQSKEEKLEQLKSRSNIKVTEVDKDILKLEYPDGKVLYKNISDYRPPVTYNLEYTPTYDSTIIDLTTVDTALYYQKYKFLQEVNVGTQNSKPPLVGDVNNNGFAEVYGQMKGYNTDFGDITIVEMNSSGIFDSVYSYDSTAIARSIYDIDKDGMCELFLYRFPPDTNYFGQSWLNFKKNSDTSLAKNLAFVFDVKTQQNSNTFGDWDGDVFTDQILGRECCPNSISIYEYNPSVNNFDSVYDYDPSQFDFYWNGFTVEDFDQDEKTDFFTGSVHGKILCIENHGNNSYRDTWHGMVGTYNAYQFAQTNDIDRNGKKEIWIGGDAFYPGIGPMTRITIFESNGNDDYKVVGRIDLIGIFSFNAQNFQPVDVDKDGIEEMMVCIEETVLILKFNGSPNHQTFELFYFKQNDLMLAGRNSVYYGATMYDVTNDGKEDIIIHLDERLENLGLRLFTFIYEADFTLGVNNTSHLPEEFHLYPNYPNPFNPLTKINFDIPEYSNVSIKVYNILGKEIATLLEKELNPGKYTIDWEANRSYEKSLPSGVYLIRLSYESNGRKYTQQMKAVLLK
jgi:hypothetical protein